MQYSSGVALSREKFISRHEKNNSMECITAASEVSSRNELPRKLASRWLSRESCGTLCVLATYPLKMALDLYGSHQAVTIVSVSKSKHVPRLSLATQGGGESVVRLEMIGRVGERRRRRGGGGRVSLCAEAIIARHGWTISGDRRRPRGGAWRKESGDRRCRRCQLRDRARRATPDLRANFSRERQLLRERNRKGAGFEGGEDGCIILTTLRKLWQHSIILGPALRTPRPPWQ